MDIPDDPLWLFSLDLYGRPGVAEACLALQDESGVDVNVVLYLLWCAATKRPLDAGAIAEADRRVSSWRRAVVEPLRAVRRAMKGPLLPDFETESLRKDVKAAELRAERFVQAALFADAPPVGATIDRETTARWALATYGAARERPLADEPVARLLEAFRGL